MKKFFFLAAAAVAALTVNAQGVWKAVTDPAIEKGAEVPALPAINNLDVVLAEGAPAGWTVQGPVTDEAKLTVQGETFSNGYVQGVTNGNQASLDKDGVESAHLEMTPAVAGKVYVVAKYGKNKPVWAAKVAAEDVEDLDKADMSAYLIEGFSTKDNLLYINQAANHTLVHYDDFTNFSDIYDYLTLDVEPGYTYYFWVNGSKVMLVGLIFETSTALENTEAAVKATKAVVNGHLVIRRGQNEFNVMGAQL